jgi:PIN domain nuclease of toxin-antitoxin system
MNFLLDTCTFLWLSQQPDKLSDKVRRIVDDSSCGLYVSDISLWEIALKHSAGRLPLPATPRLWIPEKIAYHQLCPLRLEPEAIYLSGELPHIHEDPFDRLLAAQVITSGLTLLSPDKPLASLGATLIW